jgi:asparagine synthase (glutamine-hydrolysing)
MRVDKMTMASGLEARVPFLDHKLVEFALGIPDAAKLRDGSLKAVLKKAVRGIIPDSVIDRKKQGFGVPIEEWMTTSVPDEHREAVNRFVAETDLFDRAAVSELLAQPKRAALRWSVLNVSLWWERFIQPRSESQPKLGVA